MLVLTYTCLNSLCYDDFAPYKQAAALQLSLVIERRKHVIMMSGLKQKQLGHRSCCNAREKLHIPAETHFQHVLSVQTPQNPHQMMVAAGNLKPAESIAHSSELD